MPRSFPLLFFILASTLFAGCAITHPQTAQEFREAVPGATFAKTESFVVDRSVGDVTRTFQEMAPKCLNKRIKSTSSGYMHHQVIVTDYNPTVRVTQTRTELHLQQDHVQGVMNVSNKPQRGYYLLVADATPVNKSKTRIDMYAPSVGYGNVNKAIKGWAAGKNVGCPDLTK
jgi:hypothetical protein